MKLVYALFCLLVPVASANADDFPGPFKADRAVENKAEGSITYYSPYYETAELKMKILATDLEVGIAENLYVTQLREKFAGLLCNALNPQMHTAVDSRVTTQVYAREEIARSGFDRGVAGDGLPSDSSLKAPVIKLGTSGKKASRFYVDISKEGELFGVGINKQSVFTSVTCTSEASAIQEPRSSRIVQHWGEKLVAAVVDENIVHFKDFAFKDDDNRLYKIQADATNATGVCYQLGYNQMTGFTSETPWNSDFGNQPRDGKYVVLDQIGNRIQAAKAEWYNDKKRKLPSWLGVYYKGSVLQSVSCRN